jgi:60 kDa SS-A/Ro ribonucleoprotein
MSKFNQTLVKTTTKTTNLAGGEAYKASNELALVSLLLTSFVSDQFYRTADQSLDELKNLLKKVDPKFAAKACLFARDEFGMRSVSHAMAAELAKYLSGEDYAKVFYDKIVIRPDDMMEILAYYDSNCGQKIPNSIKKGFAKAFDKFDGYQLGKYRGENKEVKLVDVVNLVHPVPNERNKEALSALINGNLKNSKTWESMLSNAGQVAKDEEDLSNLKADAWTELILNKKMGLLATLRNLRNILNQAPHMIPNVCDIITNENAITKSRVLPFRFNTAYEEISKLGNDKNVRDLLQAISKALDISAHNVPKFEDTLFVIDVSGSMSGKPSEIASLFAAMFAKVNNCDVMTFANNANYVRYNPNDSILTIKNSFKFTGGGTNFKSIFTTVNKPYKKIIIASDIQGWIGYTTPTREFNEYKKKFNCDPYIYSWDLQGYSTLQFPESKVFCLSGFSEKVFQIMSLLEEDKNALYNRINSIQL